MDTDPNTILYRVNGFDSIEVKVNPKTMEIESGKLELEQYLQHSGSLFLYQKLDLDMDIKKLRNDGKIYLAKTQDKKNGETRRKIKKWGDETRDKKT